jgi:hypothetical protein
MSKPAHRLILGIDLLKPQSEPKKITVKAISWVLSAGRFLIVFVEVLVLAAFLGRFKLDGDIAATKEAIAEQVPFVESLKADEILIRKTQFQLSTIKEVSSSNPDYSVILQKIAAQTPSGVTLSNISLDSSSGKVGIKVSGSAQTNGDLTTFFLGLKEEKSLKDVSLSNIELDEGKINFTLSASSTVTHLGDKKS